jgi:hypothetical protein
MAYILKQELFEIEKWDGGATSDIVTSSSFDADKGSKPCPTCGEKYAKHGQYLAYSPLLPSLICPRMVVMKGNYGTVLHLSEEEFKAQLEEIKT